MFEAVFLLCQEQLDNYHCFSFVLPDLVGNHLTTPLAQLLWLVLKDSLDGIHEVLEGTRDLLQE